MSWWDGDFFFGQYSNVSREAETYQEETGVQSFEATNRLVLPDLNEEVAGQTSYWQFDLNQEPCVDEDVNRECYAGKQSHPPLVAVKEEEADVVYQNMDWNTNERSLSVIVSIDYDLLAELGQLERMTTIIGEDTPWSHLFEMTYAPQYRLITVEFLSTFVYMPRGPDYQPQAGPQQSEISFSLCGFAYDLSLAEFGSALGLYTEQELEMPIYTTAIHTADDAVVSFWWPRIGDESFVRAARVTRIRDPLIRYLRRCITSSVTGRGMSQEWSTSQDLFFLYCLLSGRPCNLARCLAEYFSTYYHRQESG
ncbi:hypothetical protein R6Q57_019232 [Mikania cordata]